MNVCFVTPYFGNKEHKVSGIANHFNILTQELVSLGHNVVVVHVWNDLGADSYNVVYQNFEGGIWIEKKITSKILIKFIKRWDFIDSYLKIKSILSTTFLLPRIIKKYNIEIIETSSYFSLCFFVILFKLTKVPIVVRVSTPFKQILKDHYGFKSKALTFFSEFEIIEIKANKYNLTHTLVHANQLKDDYGIEAKAMHIIPHGIKDETFLKLDKKKNQIVYVGRYEHRKGIDILLNAIPLIVKEIPDTKFILIGGSGQEVEKEFFSNNPNIEIQSVDFRGVLERSEMDSILEESSIMIAPSRYESFGIIFIEGMKHSLPVIACNIGGAKDIIEDSINGYLIENFSFLELSQKAIHLLKHPLLIDEMGQAAYKKFKTNFTSHILATKSIEYYRQILNWDLK